MKKIIAHTLVKNEENFLWYSVASIVEHVDKIMVWDNGSSDNTVEVIQALKAKWPSKIDFKSAPGKVSEVRQQMLDSTDSDWFIVLDGDEVWWEDSIKKLVDEIKLNGNNLDTIVVPFKNLIRDMFHFQDENKGRYNIDNKIGFLTIRAINRKIQGLRVTGEYPHEGYGDSSKTLVQDLVKERRNFLESPYMHFTHLRRSSKKSDKIKYRMGLPFPKDFYYPEVFFRDRPEIVSSIWI